MAKKSANSQPTPEALANYMRITHIPLSAQYSDGGTLCLSGPP